MLITQLPGDRLTKTPPPRFAFNSVTSAEAAAAEGHPLEDEPTRAGLNSIQLSHFTWPLPALCTKGASGLLRVWFLYSFSVAVVGYEAGSLQTEVAHSDTVGRQNIKLDGELPAIKWRPPFVCRRKPSAVGAKGNFHKALCCRSCFLTPLSLPLCSSKERRSARAPRRSTLFIIIIISIISRAGNWALLF